MCYIYSSTLKDKYNSTISNIKWCIAGTFQKVLIIICLSPANSLLNVFPKVNSVEKCLSN